MKTFCVYALCDPFSGKVRYVGKTDRPKRRHAAHMSSAKRGVKRYVYDWIRSLLSRGGEPGMHILEWCVSDEEASWAEKWFIEKFRKIYALTNLTDGGDGFSGMKFSDEHREKLAERKRGRKLTEEHKRKISRSNTGRVFSEETRRKISKSNMGRKNSPESIAAGAAKLRGRKQKPEVVERLRLIKTGQKRSPEIRAKFSKIQREMKRARSPDERKRISESLRLYFSSPEGIAMKEKTSAAKRAKFAKGEIIHWTKMEKHKETVKRLKRNGGNPVNVEPVADNK